MRFFFFFKFFKPFTLDFLNSKINNNFSTDFQELLKFQVILERFFFRFLFSNLQFGYELLLYSAGRNLCLSTSSLLALFKMFLAVSIKKKKKEHDLGRKTQTRIRPKNRMKIFSISNGPHPSVYGFLAHPIDPRLARLATPHLENPSR